MLVLLSECQEHFHSDCNCIILVFIKKNYVILSQSVEDLYIGYTVARLSRFRL